MVRPAQRREFVGWARDAYFVSERRACRLCRMSTSMVRYRSVRPPQDSLRRRLRELAGVRVGAGYRQLHVLLRREGWKINHKRTYRLYTEEGLALKRRRPKRRRAMSLRTARPLPRGPQLEWAMDFVHDTLASGASLRVLTVIDLATRECVALEAGRSFGGAMVAQSLAAAAARRGGLPHRIRCDQGTEFTSMALDRWAYWNKVELDFSRPGKPGDNAHAEAFNGTLRRECLSAHWFTTVEEAQRVLDAWRADYNNTRPHRTFRGNPPALSAAGGFFVPDRSRLPSLQNC